MLVFVGVCFSLHPFSKLKKIRCEAPSSDAPRTRAKFEGARGKESFWKDHSMRLIFFVGRSKLMLKVCNGIFSRISQKNRVGLMSYFMRPQTINSWHGIGWYFEQFATKNPLVTQTNMIFCTKTKSQKISNIIFQRQHRYLTNFSAFHKEIIWGKVMPWKRDFFVARGAPCLFRVSWPQMVAFDGVHRWVLETPMISIGDKPTGRAYLVWIA